MKDRKVMKVVAIVLISLPICIIAIRLQGNGGYKKLGVEDKFLIDYQFVFKADSEFKVTTFLPVNNERQQIFLKGSETEFPASVFLDGSNKLIQWRGNSSDQINLSYEFEFKGTPVVYAIDKSIPYHPVFDDELKSTLYATRLIQSEDHRIRDLADQLTFRKQSLEEVIHALYSFVYEIPNSASSELTDALQALEKREASCNGKSRLLVALCRSMKIPSRMIGGLILEETSKKTSHAWVEILIEDTWVPFDALNGHYASLPAHYLELYKGDYFLIKHTRDMAFDYLYVINKERTNDYPVFAALNIWELMDEAGIPKDMMKVLLLLPFGAFLVAIFKNVIGLKTYGVFLPVLISLSLLETGLAPGLVLFTLLIGVVALINFPLELWGIQYNSKIASMLIAVVVVALISIKILHFTGWLEASAPLFFPIIILTIVSERVARKIEEEGTKASIELYATTLIVTTLIYFVLSSETILDFVMTFPEVILSVAGLNLLLGKWIGLRVMEYYRFHRVKKEIA